MPVMPGDDLMLVILVIVLAVLGMIAGAILSRRGDRRGNVVAIVAAAVGVVAALGHGLGLFSEPPPVHQRERAYEHIAGQRVGVYVAEQKPGARVVVIAPFEHYVYERRRQALLVGLTEGLGDAVTVTATVEPPLPPDVRAAYEAYGEGEGEGDEEFPPIDAWFTVDYFDNLLAEHAGDADVVISLAGLPTGAAKLAFWDRADRPVIVSVFGPSPVLGDRIASGDVLAAVKDRLSATYTGEMPEDFDLVAAFNRRFVMVTAENLAEVREQSPRLFARESDGR